LYAFFLSSFTEAGGGDPMWCSAREWCLSLFLVLLGAINNYMEWRKNNQQINKNKISIITSKPYPKVVEKRNGFRNFVLTKFLI